MKKQNKEISPFTKKVIDLILQIPKGKVATYGQIAKLAGSPQGSRGVSWILSSMSAAYKLPWQRVINSQGKISFSVGSSHFREQKKILQKEAVVVEADGSINLEEFQWQKEKPKKKTSKKGPRMFADD